MRCSDRLLDVRGVRLERGRCLQRGLLGGALRSFSSSIALGSDYVPRSCLCRSRTSSTSSPSNSRKVFSGLFSSRLPFFSLILREWVISSLSAVLCVCVVSRPGFLISYSVRSSPSGKEKDLLE